MTGFLFSKPDDAAIGVAFAQSIRDNFWAVWATFVTTGIAPGFNLSHNNSPTSAPTIYYLQEQLGNATADGRASGTRIFYRVTLTYTSGKVTKVQLEYSADSGGTYSALVVDAAGNSFLNFDYTGRTIPFGTWATS